MKAISKTGYFFILATLIAITAMLFGCGGDETAEVVEDAAVVEQSTDAPVTVADTIELALNKIIRFSATLQMDLQSLSNLWVPFPGQTNVSFID